MQTLTFTFQFMDANGQETKWPNADPIQLAFFSLDGNRTPLDLHYVKIQPAIAETSARVAINDIPDEAKIVSFGEAMHALEWDRSAYNYAFSFMKESAPFQTLDPRRHDECGVADKTMHVFALEEWCDKPEEAKQKFLDDVWAGYGKLLSDPTIKPPVKRILTDQLRDVTQALGKCCPDTGAKPYTCTYCNNRYTSPGPYQGDYNAWYQCTYVPRCI